MKLRTFLILIVGLAIGYKLAKRATQDDPLVVKGPQRQQSGSPKLRVITGQAQRLADQATGKSLEAIRGARRALQNRLTDSQDDAAWN